MIGLSGALGTGLFLGSGSTISLGGPATVLSYALAGSAALAVVWALAEIVSTHPVPGGHGAAAASYLGRFGGFVARWNFAITMLIAVGAEVAATATYLKFWFPGLPLAVGTVLCSLFIVGLNLATVHLYGASEYWFSMIKVTAIVVFILLGAVLLFTGLPGRPAVGFHNLTAHGGFFATGFTGMLTAACMAVFSFGGIENVSVGAAESEHPERDVPRAARTMIWRLLLFYIFALFIVVTLQPWTVTAASSGEVTESPFVQVLDVVGIPAAADIMNAILIVAALSAANGCLYSSSRMIHSLALDRMAPRFASHTSLRGAPRGAVAIATLGMVIASILSLISPNAAFMYLYGCATVGVLLTWIIVMATHLAFRAKRKAAGLTPAAHRLRGAPLVNWLVIVASIAVFIVLPTTMPVVRYVGVPYLIALVLVYAILARTRTLPTPPDFIARDSARARCEL
ncbi:amino acid permease [Actinobaculum sp. 352]|nr:amino acid permease [Actinobaculum sp. 313]RTE48054.1 amino acid permease [Actinobaculum sp. 352]